MCGTNIKARESLFDCLNYFYEICHNSKGHIFHMKRASRLTRRIDWEEAKREKGELVAWSSMVPNPLFDPETTPRMMMINGTRVQLRIYQGPLMVPDSSPNISQREIVHESILKQETKGPKNSPYYVMRQRTITLDMTSPQMELVGQMVEDAQTTFNLCRNHPLFTQCVLDIKSSTNGCKDIKAPSPRDISKAIVNKKGLLNGDHDHLLRTPADIRDNAVRDCVSSLKGVITKIQRGLMDIDQFEMGVTDTYNIIRFNPTIGLYPDVTVTPHTVRIGVNGDRIPLVRAFPFVDDIQPNIRQTHPDVYKHGMFIELDKLHGTALLHIPYQLEVEEGYVSEVAEAARNTTKYNTKRAKFKTANEKYHKKIKETSSAQDPRPKKKQRTMRSPTPPSVPSQQVDRSRVIGIDPGVRCFITGYTGDGRVVEIGANMVDLLTIKFKKLDKIEDKLRKLTAMGNTKMIKKYTKLRVNAFHKISKEVSHWHFAIAKYLAQNFDMILYPSFNSKDFRTGGYLQSNTKRIINQLAYFKFKHKLVEASTKFSTFLSITTEEYTTKACASCHIVNKSQGGRKVFTCDGCGFSTGRDINGAMNNLAKYVV